MMSRGDVLTLTPSEQRRRLATTPPPLLHNTDCTSVANVSTTSPSSSNEQSLPTDVMAAMCTPAYLQHVFNERDKAWRARHARELDRVHAEHAHMLHMLHTEVERLQAMLRVASIHAYEDMYGEQSTASCNHVDKDRQIAELQSELTEKRRELQARDILIMQADKRQQEVTSRPIVISVGINTDECAQLAHTLYTRRISGGGGESGQAHVHEPVQMAGDTCPPCAQCRQWSAGLPARRHCATSTATPTGMCSHVCPHRSSRSHIVCPAGVVHYSK